MAMDVLEDKQGWSGLQVQEKGVTALSCSHCREINDWAGLLTNTTTRDNASAAQLFAPWR